MYSTDEVIATQGTMPRRELAGIKIMSNQELIIGVAATLNFEQGILNLL